MNVNLKAPEVVQSVLAKLTLAYGGHDNLEQGVCLLEAVSYIAGEKFSDHPQCVSPVLGAYGRRLNDLLADEDRQKLKPFIPQMIGTAGDGLDDARRWLATDWAVRVATPRWLDAAGMSERAEELRALAPIVDRATADAARSASSAARDEAYAARLKSREALRARVREALAKRGVDSAAAAAAIVADAAAAAAIVADAAADAAAAAAIVADAAADAAAAAAAAIVAKFSPEYWERYDAVYKAIYDQLRAKYRAGIDGTEFARVREVNNREGIELLGRMIAPMRPWSDDE